VIVRDTIGQIDKEAAMAALAARREPANSLRRGRPGQNGEIIARGSEALSTLML